METKTWDIDADMPREVIISWVVTVARFVGGRLKHVVLNCHSTPAYLMLGRGFDSRSVALFAGWRGLVDNIWLPNCGIAGFGVDKIDGTIWDGRDFCSKMAMHARCRVVAPTGTQSGVAMTLPVNMMPVLDGEVLVFGQNGDIIARKVYPPAQMNAAGQWIPRDYSEQVHSKGCGAIF